MKKVLFAAIVLTFFAVAISLFQISCQKEAIANSNYILQPATKTTLGGVIVGSGLTISSNGQIDITQKEKIVYIKHSNDNPREIWTANYDGSNQAKLNLNLSGLRSGSYPVNAHISPDGEKLFITFWENGSSHASSIYSCNLDGSNLIKVIDGAGLGDEGLNLTDVY